MGQVFLGFFSVPDFHLSLFLCHLIFDSCFSSSWGLCQISFAGCVYGLNSTTMLGQRGLSLSLAKIYGVPGELRFAHKQLCHSPTHKETMTF